MEAYYRGLEKAEIFQAPNRYAWNILLRAKQFTREELLEVREYCPLVEMIRFQESVTLPFLRTHFAAEIDDCLEVDWEDCRKWAGHRIFKCDVIYSNAEES
jgi:hypothetical protein